MKSLHEDDMTHKLRDRLGRYEEQPPDGVWDRIATSVGTTSTPSNVNGAGVWTNWVDPISYITIGAFIAWSMLPIPETGREVATEADSAKAAQTALVGTPVRASGDEAASTTSGSPEVVGANAIYSRPVVDEYPSDTAHTSDSPPVPLPQNTLAPASNETEAVVAVAEEPIKYAASTSDSSFVVAPQLQQTIVKPKVQKMSWLQAYVSLTPSLAYAKLKPIANDLVIVEGLAFRPSMSRERFGLSLDAGFQGDVTRTISIYGGASFYRQRQTLTYNYLENTTSATSSGDAWSVTITPARASRSFDYSMTNIGARAGALVTLKGDRLKHRVGGGLAWQHGFSASPDSYRNDRSWYLAGQMLYRSEYTIHEGVAVFVESSFSYALVSRENLDAPFKLSPYRVGVGAGVVWRLGHRTSDVARRTSDDRR